MNNMELEAEIAAGIVILLLSGGIIGLLILALARIGDLLNDYNTKKDEKRKAKAIAEALDEEILKEAKTHKVSTPLDYAKDLKKEQERKSIVITEVVYAE